jgi:hypothetical protein
MEITQSSFTVSLSIDEINKLIENHLRTAFPNTAVANVEWKIREGYTGWEQPGDFISPSEVRGVQIILFGNNS